MRPRNLPSRQELPALPLEQCLAKTYTAADGTVEPGISVFDHCCIVGEVARKLIEIFPLFLRDVYFPSGAAYLASVHDTGKVSPTMQEKLRRAIKHYAWNSLPELTDATIADPSLEKRWGGHATISQAALDSLSPGKHIAAIAGKHHGFTSQGAYTAIMPVFGGIPWHERRIELVQKLAGHFAEQWPCVHSETKADVLAGLTTVADWIGSGSCFEPLMLPWQERVDAAVAGAGFVTPHIKQELSFVDIFGNTPYPVQEQLYTACTGPGVYMLEAPMGVGKTEAALYAAYLLLARSQATGLYFALPTRLTSNKIHERVQPFLEKILTPDSPHRQALLLHGNAHLQETEMGEEGAPGQSWFNSLKRSLLAPFGVGTLDQALLAALPDVKHSFVRSFGLLGKVVILDEVHTYDTYTGVILDKLVDKLCQLSCSVIILSATITQKRRQSLLGAKPEQQEYPLISAVPEHGVLCEYPVPPLPENTVLLNQCQKMTDAFEESFERAAQGQQVLWIENTVAEAQEVYKHLASAADGENIGIGLIHSRFLHKDRAMHEAEWINCYGKDAGEKRQQQGRILVGTQVLEQSLDIDADFLVTRLCPMDMLLQRLGRLWRHSVTARPPKAQREAWILVPAENDNSLLGLNAFGNSGRIYEPYVLYRTFEALSGLNSVHLPGDIRPLIEATYAERQEPPPLLALKAEMERKAAVRKQQALLAASALGQHQRETAPSTRYSELDSTQVLLIRHMQQTSNGVSVTFLDGTQTLFPRNVRACDKYLWRQLAVLLEMNTLTVTEYHAPQSFPQPWLKEFLYTGEDGSALRVASVNESGTLCALDGGAPSVKYALRYSAILGYSAVKKL